MTIKELIDELENLLADPDIGDKEVYVYFQYEYNELTSHPLYNKELDRVEIG